MQYPFDCSLMCTADFDLKGRKNILLIMNMSSFTAASKELAVELSNTIKHYQIDAEYPEPVYAMKEEEDTDA